MRRVLKIELDGVTREVLLGTDEMKEFTTKFQTIGFENSIEQFIVNDIGGLLENELYETFPASARIIPAGKSKDEALTAAATSPKVRFNSLSRS